MITDVQRFTLNDGPGIRTTVFLKGCNMACAWCHNPETLSMDPEILIYPQKCIGCGACVGFDQDRCREGLPPKRENITPEDAKRCFSGALGIAGREMSAQEVMAEVEQDALYYQTSGGGLTLSGGEVMAQPGFAKELLALCRQKGIPTAIETNLAYDFGLLEPLLPLIDLVMGDIKLMDGDKHRQVTGIGNESILANVEKLSKSGTPYILRTPVIPGVNDTAEEIGRIAAFVAKNKDHLLYYELLNFNPLGASKYESLGVINAHRDARPLANDKIEALKAAAEAAGIPVRVG